MNNIEQYNFNPNPPLSNTNKKYIILKNKEDGVIFWTSGGEYRNDWYELVFENDDIEEVRIAYMKMLYNKK